MLNKILFLLGLTLTVAGIVAGSITNSWLLIPAISISTGIVSIAIGLLLARKHKKSFWFKRSTKVRTNAAIATTAILIILGSINFVAIRNNIRWDLTETKLFTLAPQTQTIVQNLDRPLKVWVFNRNIDPSTKNLLENYRRYNDLFQFEFVDPEREIAISEQFGVRSFGEIHLEYGDKKQRIKVRESELESSISEPQLTNAIEAVKRDRPISIYFLQGHGESSLEAVEGGLSQAVASLEAKGYQVQSLNLANSSKIPNGANVIVIAGATRQLFPAEVSSLEQYLNSGGNILLLLAPSTELGITNLLNNWGIKLDQSLIVDVSGSGNILGLGPAAPIIDSYGEHPITNSFRNGLSIFPESRPIAIVEKNKITSTPLVVTDDESWGETDLSNSEIAFDPNKDTPGPLNIAIASTKIRERGESRLVVFGSVAFASNGWFGQQLNSDLFLNSIDWLIGENEQNLSVRPKEQTNRRIDLSSFQASLIGILATRIMPFLSLAFAGFLWWKRR